MSKAATKARARSGSGGNGNGNGNGKDKGLRHFAKIVCDKVEARKVTTYNEVADELVAEFNRTSGQPVDSKNIRRRVYDALNVLTAMNVIEKEKKVIRWKGLPTETASTPSNTPSSASSRRSSQRQQLLQQQQQEQSYNQSQTTIAENEEIARRNDRIAQKKQYLAELDYQKGLYETLVARNIALTGSQGKGQDCIPLPFIIVHTKQEAVINCEMSPNRTEYFLDFSLPFSIHDDNEVLKNMFPLYEGQVVEEGEYMDDQDHDDGQEGPTFL